MKNSLYRNFLIVICLLVISTACGEGSKEATAKKEEKKESPLSSVPRDTPIPGNIGQPSTSSTPSNNTSTTASSTTQPTPSTSANGLRPVDQKIMAQLALPVTGDKLKDAFPKEPYKVNFIKEGTDKGWSRIKIDLNRNEKWDEKWDLVDGKPAKRQVASKDDENYDQKFVWKDGKWEAEK
jgi:hypothetical protein